MRILITGAAGFIGSHLAERLASLGHTVRGLDCMTDYYARALKELNRSAVQARGVTFFPLDLAVDDLSEAVRGVEIIYHLAAQPGLSATSTFDTYVRNNITATYRLIEAVKKAPSLKGLVYISTSSVYGFLATESEEAAPQPTSYYGVTKLAAEQLVLAHARDQGLPACSVRLFSVYGPRERPDKLYPKLIRCALEDRPLPLFAGSEEHVRSYTYIDDSLAGLVAIPGRLDRCLGEIFNIGTDATITTGEGIRLVQEITGRPLRINRLPRRPGDQLRTQANIAKARRVLGYNPSTRAREGLEKEVEWYRENILGKIDLWPDSI